MKPITGDSLQHSSRLLKKRAQAETDRDRETTRRGRERPPITFLLHARYLEIKTKQKSIRSVLEERRQQRGFQEHRHHRATAQEKKRSRGTCRPVLKRREVFIIERRDKHALLYRTVQINFCCGSDRWGKHPPPTLTTESGEVVQVFRSNGVKKKACFIARFRSTVVMDLTSGLTLMTKSGKVVQVFRSNGTKRKACFIGGFRSTVFMDLTGGVPCDDKKAGRVVQVFRSNGVKRETLLHRTVQIDCCWRSDCWRNKQPIGGPVQTRRRFLN